MPNQRHNLPPMDQMCLQRSYLVDISFTTIACGHGSSVNKAARHGKPIRGKLVILPVGVDSILCSRQSVLDNSPQNQQRQPPPVRPQPQAGARQLPNLFGVHQAGVQPENDALARVLGRFARNAAQPPQPAPGQHPQAQGLQNTGTQGWVPGPTPGVVIQYNIQYQGQPPHGQVQPPQSLQPVPPFAGFVGPNQDWRSWDFDQRWVNQGSTSASREPPTSGDQVSTSHGQSRDASQTPAEAALRRLGGHSTTSAAFRTRSETIPPPSSSSDTSTWKVPSLIPLDSSQSTSSHIRSSSSAAPPVQVSSSSLFAAGSQTTRPQPSERDRGLVTDAQLALLDRNTREAIDERIRILQDVSDTISRCVEDLVRARSILPPSLSTVPPPETTTSDVQCTFVVPRNDMVITQLFCSFSK